MTTLSEISALCSYLAEAERNVETAEKALSEAKERARQLREESIPLSMAEIGLEEIKLDTGEKITIKQDVYASIPVANRETAYSWLEDHGHGGLIKTKVEIGFGKGEMEEAKALLETLQGEGLEPSLNREVNSQTLKAWLREMIANGENVPLEMFGARPVSVAKVTKS
jgi:hypothetical protein